VIVALDRPTLAPVRGRGDRAAVQLTSLPARADRLLDLRLFSLHGTPVTLEALLVFVVMVAATVLLARLSRSGARRALTRHDTLDAGTAHVAAQLVQYLVLVLGLGVSLETLGVNLATFFAAGAFLAVAAGFAMQSIAQNFVSGVILLFERHIKPGDVLELDDRVVRVTRMGLRATIARTPDEEDLIIPNSILAQQIVTNYTLLDSNLRLYSTVDVGYDSDLDLVSRTLQAAAAGVPGRLSKPEPRVLLTSLGASGVTFEVSIWVSDPWSERVTRSHLNEAIWRSLQKAGIAMH
jgi:small-conductance mechanosensitive channel